ncbi:MAG: AAA family ATPase [Deltaproteobacteria bacterium]|nr:AAA family ATPase [Deltaproteobacteria bacterium]
MNLAEVLEGHRVVVCVGSGGVGKTTTAAALALRAAMDGRRVLCLTIDPAKRLATSLGLDTMTTEERVVPSSLFEAQGLECSGELSAMMLDTKRTFDELVERYASSPTARDRILNNDIYRYVSSSLAGTQEYMAMEKLHALRQGDHFDLIVLDTPPTSNALDFLDAPERLVAMIDSPAMRWFVQAFEGAGKMSFNLLGKGAAFLLKGISHFTGGEFLAHIAEFVTGLNELFGGFRERAAKVSESLRQDDVAFVVVTSPAPMAVREAIFFARHLANSGLADTGFVINGMRPLLREPSANRDALRVALAQLLPEDANVDDALTRLETALDDERLLAVGDRIEADRLRSQVGEDKHVIEVPAFDEDVHDLAALAELARYLVGERRTEAIS